MRPSRRIRLAAPTLQHRQQFLSAVRRSRRLHARWVSPPSTASQYATYLTRARRDDFMASLVCCATGELAGVIDVSNIVRGVFQSGYLSFYAFTPHAGHGIMRDALVLVLQRCFRREGLHRLEANIQPGNTRSIGLVMSLGFRHEGYSPRYLKIAGRWRDHERWAITVEDWRRFNSPARSRRELK